MTKDELVRDLVRLAADVKADRSMLHGDIDHLARLLGDQRHIIAVAKRKRGDQPAPMRPLGSKPSEKAAPEGKIWRNMSTPESRAFWEICEEAEREVDTWPDWKKNW